MAKLPDDRENKILFKHLNSDDGQLFIYDVSLCVCKMTYRLLKKCFIPPSLYSFVIFKSVDETHSEKKLVSGNVSMKLYYDILVILSCF